MKATTSASTRTGPAATAAETAEPNAARNSPTWGSVAADTDRLIVAGEPAKAICGWTSHPAAAISSQIVNGAQAAPVRSANRGGSGSATTVMSGISSLPATIPSTTLKN